MRQRLIPNFLAVASEMNARGWVLKVVATPGRGVIPVCRLVCFVWRITVEIY
jgi:hypothetical protein